MPIPSKKKGETPKKFMSRCMSDDVMKNEYPDQSQRSAVCMSKATEYISLIEEASFLMSHYKLESDDKAGYPPNCNEGYVEKDGKCVPLKKEEASFRYEHPKTGEVYTYNRKGVYKKDGVFLIYKGKSKEE